jgi:hypothetical protein
MDKLNTESSTGKDKYPKSDHIEKGSDGWLSPQGNYYKVGTEEHDESASYLITNSLEVKRLASIKITDWAEKDKYQSRNDREKLEQLGYILIRGEILSSNDASNFTPQQLEKISEANIRIVSAFEGSKEYSSRELLARINKIRSRLSKNLSHQIYYDGYDNAGTETSNSIKEFLSDPLHSVIKTFNIYKAYENGTSPEVPTEIFSILSEGFSEQMDISVGRHDFTFRVINLGHGEKMWIQRKKYWHDGQSYAMISWDVEDNLSMFVADDFSIIDKLDKIIFSRGTGKNEVPKITLSSKDGYFSSIINRLVTS